MRTSLALRVGLIWLAVIMLAPSSYAAHPQLLLDATELEFIHHKVMANTADWRALKGQCDDLATYSVQWPDAVSGGGSRVRGFVAGTGGSAGMIFTGFNGGRFEKAITELGLCYQASKPTNPKDAAKYLAQAHNIITAMAQPPLTMTRQGDGVVRYAISVDAHGQDLRAGDPVGVYMPHSTIGPKGDVSKSVNLGEVWAISGAAGCTSLNGTWRVSSKFRNTISFTNPDGSPAPPLNANCTLFTFDPMRGYALRFWIPALARAYDWFYDGLTQKEKDELVFCMNAWMYELAIGGQSSSHPENNFSFDNFWALVAAYVATDGDNSGWTSFYRDHIAERLTGPNQILDYRRRWLAGGGFGEGWQAYGFNSIRAMMNALLAMKIHGTDWTQPPYNFNFVNDTLMYWMEFTTPSKLALDDNEYVFPASSVDKGVTEPVWIPLHHAVMFTAVARRLQSPLAAQFQGWYQEVYAKERAAAGKNLPEWNSGVYHSEPDPEDEFLYHDPQAETSDWKTLPLMYRAWSGNYAVSRTDWTDNSVEVTLLGGPTVGSAGNGKTQFNSGSVTVQRGNNRLVVYGLGEASRSGDILSGEQVNRLHQERGTYGNKKNSIFWAGSSLAETRNQGLTSRTPPPGQTSSVLQWGSSIDRAEDSGPYTYWRASGLETNNARSAVDGKYHQTAWTREVFFLRPKLVVVHDRTSVLNDADDRTMFWTFGRNIERTSVPAGMTSYEAKSKGVYRGAFTSVLPASPATVSVTDHDNLHYLYRVEVRPAAMDHRDDDWLAVIDAADSPRKSSQIARITSVNADAVQFDDAQHAIIAFPRSNQPVLPIHLSFGQRGDIYIVGLEASTNYKAVLTGSELTIASDDGTNRVMSTEVGIVRIPSR
jgi:hypothetical protein